MSQTTLLYNLQQIDSEILQKKRVLTGVLQAQKESDALKTVREVVDQFQKNLRSALAKQQDISLESDTLNGRIKRSENRLYSGKVTSPKELTDLQSSLAALKRQLGLIEDKFVDAMVLVEDLTIELKSNEETLLEIESGWEKQQAELKKEQRTLALRINELLAMRKKRLPLIQPEILTIYRRIFKKKKGLAIVDLKRDRCMGCQLTVSAIIMKTVAEGQLAYCRSCERILYTA